jgi:hypothetical protein
LDKALKEKSVEFADKAGEVYQSVKDLQDDAVRDTLGRKISEALQELLSKKHLYQSINVDTAFLDQVAVARHKEAQIKAATPHLGGGGPPYVPPLDGFRGVLDLFVQAAWFPSGARPLVDTGMDILYQNDPRVQKYLLPAVKLTCNRCGERGPFNPVGALVENARRASDNQWVYLSYECQNCKGEPIRFLIRRKETKLTLSGRDPFETIELPSFVPKQHADSLRNALIANHAGQTLAGVFLMRVFIEQFWKSLPEVIAAVKHKARPTGDELGEAYKAILPAPFKERFPTLAETYGALSEDMHSARGSAVVFEKSYAQIIEHFDARRLLFKLLVEQNQSDPPQEPPSK